MVNNNKNNLSLKDLSVFSLFSQQISLFSCGIEDEKKGKKGCNRREKKRKKSNGKKLGVVDVLVVIVLLLLVDWPIVIFIKETLGETHTQTHDGQQPTHIHIKKDIKIQKIEETKQW